MIRVDGNEIEVGEAYGDQLIQEVSLAVLAVFKTLKRSLPKDLDKSDGALMHFIIREVVRRISLYDCIDLGQIDTDDFLNSVFENLLKEKGGME